MAAVQAVVLGIVTRVRRPGVVGCSLHNLLLPIDPADPTTVFWVVLIGAAVLVLLLVAGAWFHAPVYFYVLNVGNRRFCPGYSLKLAGLYSRAVEPVICCDA